MQTQPKHKITKLQIHNYTGKWTNWTC